MKHLPFDLLPELLLGDFLAWGCFCLEIILADLVLFLVTVALVLEALTEEVCLVLLEIFALACFAILETERRIWSFQ